MFLEHNTKADLFFLKAVVNFLQVILNFLLEFFVRVATKLGFH